MTDIFICAYTVYCYYSLVKLCVTISRQTNSCKCPLLKPVELQAECNKGYVKVKQVRNVNVHYSDSHKKTFDFYVTE